MMHLGLEPKRFIDCTASDYKSTQQDIDDLWELVTILMMRE